MIKIWLTKEKGSGLRVFGHNELNKSATALKATNVKAIHRDRSLFLPFFNCHVVSSSACQARVSDNPLLGRVLRFRSQELYELVNVFSSLLQPVSEVGVLVK